MGYLNKYMFSPSELIRNLNEYLQVSSALSVSKQHLPLNPLVHSDMFYSNVYLLNKPPVM